MHFSILSLPKLDFSQLIQVILVYFPEVLYAIKHHHHPVKARPPCQHRNWLSQQGLCNLWAEYACCKYLYPLLFLLIPDIAFKARLCIRKIMRAEADFFIPHFSCKLFQVANEMPKVCIFINYNAFCLVELKSVAPVHRVIPEAFAYCEKFHRKLF